MFSQQGTSFTHLSLYKEVSIINLLVLLFYDKIENNEIKKVLVCKISADVPCEIDFKA